MYLPFSNTPWMKYTNLFSGKRFGIPPPQHGAIQDVAKVQVGNRIHGHSARQEDAIQVVHRALGVREMLYDPSSINQVHGLVTDRKNSDISVDKKVIADPVRGQSPFGRQESLDGKIHADKEPTVGGHALADIALPAADLQKDIATGP